MINALETWRKSDLNNWVSNTWTPNNFSGPSLGFFQFNLNNMSATTEIRVKTSSVGRYLRGSATLKTIKKPSNSTTVWTDLIQIPMANSLFIEIYDPMGEFCLSNHGDLVPDSAADRHTDSNGIYINVDPNVLGMYLSNGSINRYDTLFGNETITNFKNDLNDKAYNSPILKDDTSYIESWDMGMSFYRDRYNADFSDSDVGVSYPLDSNGNSTDDYNIGFGVFKQQRIYLCNTSGVTVTAQLEASLGTQNRYGPSVWTTMKKIPDFQYNQTVSLDSTRYPFWRIKVTDSGGLTTNELVMNSSLLISDWN